MTPQELIVYYARQMGIDPRAALAVARTEGGLANRAGDVGDLSGGGSYGPFQLYAQGALPQQYRGNPQAADAWAWSAPGIQYAIRQMSKAGASGLTGNAAVNTIVRRFERPADPDSQVAKAMGYYGGAPVTGAGIPQQAGPGMAAAPEAPAPAQSQMPMLSPILAATASQDPQQQSQMLLGALMQAPKPMQSHPSVAPAQANPATDTPNSGADPNVRYTTTQGTPAGVREMFYDPRGAYDEGQWISPIGGHSDHVHVSFGNPTSAIAIMNMARKMGLRVGENPYYDQVDPVHTQGSYHYQLFPGKYNGRQLGRAADISGSAALMSALWDRVLKGYNLR